MINLKYLALKDHKEKIIAEMSGDIISLTIGGVFEITVDKAGGRRAFKTSCPLSDEKS